MLGAGALGRPGGMKWVERWEGGSGWGTHVHPWRIHVDVWQTNTILQSNSPPIKINKVIFLKKELISAPGRGL